MTFQVAPMLPGDMYDAALRFGNESMTALSAPGADTSTLRHALWRQAVEMGWPAILIPEALGGAGGAIADIAAVVEATGRFAMGLPLIDRAAVVPALLTGCGSAKATALLEEIAAGKADVASVLDPLKTLADLTIAATHYLVALAERRILLLVPAAALPLGRSYRSVDGRVMAEVLAERIEVEQARVVARGEAFDQACAAAQRIGASLVCVETVGAQGALIELTIDYLATRHQFGQALASFQVLRHRVVDMYVGYECSRGLVEHALQDGRAGADVSIVKCYVARTGRLCAESAIQLHGGMGMTEELLVARLAERAISAEFDHGDRYFHLRRLALRDDSPAPAASIPVPAAVAA